MTTTGTATEHAVAALLRDALRDARPIAPVRRQLGDDVDAAYRVQNLLLHDLSGRDDPRVGRKVGLTSLAVQQQLGVDQPDFGVLLSSMQISDGGLFDVDELIAPRIEAEIAFVLAHDVTDASPQAVAAAVDYAVAALEIVDSRIEGWDISIVDTVSDNASSARFVLGSHRLRLSQFEPRAAQMVLHVNGQPVSSGSGVACLDDPLRALTWVAQTAARLGDPLRAGEIILSGALGPMVPLRNGDNVTAEIRPLGHVSVTAGKELRQ